MGKIEEEFYGFAGPALREADPDDLTQWEQYIAGLEQAMHVAKTVYFRGGRQGIAAAAKALLGLSVAYTMPTSMLNRLHTLIGEGR